MNKRIVIVGNGTLSKKCLTIIQRGDYVIGVDRAASWLIQEGRIPDMAIGDFDSVTKEELKHIQQSVKNIQRFPKDKDSTDMELAVVHAIEMKPTEVLVLGGTGSRMDHTMATWHLLDLLLEEKILHVLLNETNRIRLVGRGKTIIEKASYRYISILPYTKSIMLSLNGFRYNLVYKTLQQGTTLGVSNEIQKAQGIIRIFSGKAWVIESND
ncbi:MAG: thiamine diphosphokinase [Candidatus Gottesmanbacteria bacterium]|nr:thiamine diphosphokinase [Candidatus Gottesmanbacteria bacterium]